MSTTPQELKITVDGLRVGMFVSRLDRPWISTPFVLEGVQVGSAQELRELRRLCSHVYVDIRRGLAPELAYVVREEPVPGAAEPPAREYARLRSTTWEIRSDLQAEIPAARSAHRHLRQGISEIMHDLKVGQVLKLDKLRGSVDAMVDSITRNPAAFGWLREIKRTDNYAYHHALACSVWAASFGRHLGLNREELTELTLAGLLFDVGKTRIDFEVLGKQGMLDSNERELVQSHVAHSVELLQQAGEEFSPRVIEAVATHHERHDGSGYPAGLADSAIPVYGRILGLIDSYEAMTSTRPHRAGCSPHEAVMGLYAERDRLFQAELVEQFIQTSGIYPVGSLVELTDGRVGVITTVHNLKRLRPSVMVLLDANKNPLEDFETVDLWREHKDYGGYALSVKTGLPHGTYDIDATKLFLD